MCHCPVFFMLAVSVNKRKFLRATIGRPNKLPVTIFPKSRESDLNACTYKKRKPMLHSRPIGWGLQGERISRGSASYPLPHSLLPFLWEQERKAPGRDRQSVHLTVQRKRIITFV